MDSIKLSLVFLKGLTELRIVYNSQPSRTLDELFDKDKDKGHCLMTEASALFGFGKDLMPGLEVIIGFGSYGCSEFNQSMT